MFLYWQARPRLMRAGRALIMREMKRATEARAGKILTAERSAPSRFTTAAPETVTPKKNPGQIGSPRNPETILA